MPVNNKLLFPKVSHVFAAAESTNSLAVAAVTAQEPPAQGAVFLAHEQTDGKGQGENRWHATPYDNLSLSVVTYPEHLPIANLFVLNQVASLAVARTVKDYLPAHLAPRVSVKWPNDVYVGDKKIAGILIQNGLRGSRLAWSVIGIGLNVNETNFPENLRGSATSLKLLTGAQIELEPVRGHLFEHLSELYRFTDHRLLPTIDRYYHDLLYRRDEPSQFYHVATGRTFHGVIKEVTAAGLLRVVMVGGRTSDFELREVRLSRES